MATQTVDFYFDFSSTNSYFAAFMLPELCRHIDARINWLPIHLGALFRTTGFDVMAMTPRKARYLWRDHQRYAELTGLPFRRPSRFPIKTAAALRAVLAAAQEVDARGDQRAAESARERFSQAMFRAYWELDEDIASGAVIARVAEEAGFASAALLEAADSAAVREQLAAITATAVTRGVFGAPMFFVGDEMFWGKDRLDFVERWLQRQD
jgi:2-hydroxychromene-2-carboxylate isomerase